MNQAEAPVVILSHERSGSHLLGDYIASLENVLVLDEVCNPDAVDPLTHDLSFLAFQHRYAMSNTETFLKPTFKDRVQFIRSYFEHVRDSSEHRVVLHIKYGHVHHFNWLWTPLFARPLLFVVLQRMQAPVIHLHRENVVEAAVSDQYARARNAWHSWQLDADKEKVTSFECDVPSAVAAALLLKEQYRWISDRWMQQLKCYDLTYEDLCAQDDRRELVLERIATFLNRKPVVNWQPKLKKLGRPLRELARNYDALKNACIAAKLHQHVDVTDITDTTHP